MNADDLRHGSHRGYVVGCREECCVRAHRLYMKLYRMGRKPRLVSPVGTVRRIQALQALGWSAREIGARVGRSDNWVHMIVRSPNVTTTTADLVAKAYDELSMVVPIGRYHTRCRNHARRLGYLPPLAWDDIDRDPEPPAALYSGPDIDPVVVMRLLEGCRVKANAAEREEALAQWRADGGSEREFCRLHGFKAGRYGRLRLVESEAS